MNNLISWFFFVQNLTNEKLLLKQVQKFEKGEGRITEYRTTKLLTSIAYSLN